MLFFCIYEKTQSLHKCNRKEHRPPFVKKKVESWRPPERNTGVVIVLFFKIMKL